MIFVQLLYSPCRVLGSANFCSNNLTLFVDLDISYYLVD